MFRSPAATAVAAALTRSRVGMRRRAVPAALVALSLVAAAATVGRSSARAASTCDFNATPSTFASQVSAASAGQSICLASGSYGTWSGTNKQVTIRAATGATPTMKIEFDTGDSGFTLDGIGGLGGDMLNGSSNITIRNSTFTSTLNIDGNANNQPRNIVLDHNQHTFAGQMGSGDLNGKIRIRNNAGSFTGVTVENSTFANGDWDGIHLGGGANIINNTFSDLCDTGGNHTDNIQFEGGAGGDIRGNYIHSTCTTQGITSYDGATNGVTIEDNVIDIRRAWGIEFYSDKNSIIRHNTIRYYAPGCYANSPCGYISLDRKTQDPAGTGTQVYDNIAMITIDDGSTAARNDHNLNNNQVTYTGPTTTYNGYKLNPNSPGHNAADDGQDDGARIGSTSPSPAPTPTPTPKPSPTPTPPPPPANKPAKAVWTAPSGAKVGTAVTLDGSRSTGDAPMSCTWTFEDQSGSTVFETQTGCKLQKAFKYAGTKYVKLTVKDGNGDTNSNKQSFDVAAAGGGTDTPAKAVWTAPKGARVGTAVTLDGTRSTGDAPMSCTWTFEDQSGSTVFETQTGCKLQKAFKYAGTKYVKLSVRDADGDTSSNKQSFPVSA